MTLYLIRHPATPWTGIRYLGQHEADWSQTGNRRAHELVAGLRSKLGPASIVLTSPLRRARALAAMMASASGSRMDIDDRWLEVDVGRFEGCTFAELEALDPHLAVRLAAGDLDLDWPGGERYADLEQRVLAAFHDLLLRPERPALLVTHAGPIAVLLRHLQPGRDMPRFVGPGDALALEGSEAGPWTVRPVAIGSRP